MLSGFGTNLEKTVQFWELRRGILPKNFRQRFPMEVSVMCAVVWKVFFEWPGSFSVNNYNLSILLHLSVLLLSFVFALLSSLPLSFSALAYSRPLC